MSNAPEHELLNSGREFHLSEPAVADHVSIVHLTSFGFAIQEECSSSLCIALRQPAFVNTTLCLVCIYSSKRRWLPTFLH